MKLEKRYFEHTQDELKEATKILRDENKSQKLYSDEALKGLSVNADNKTVPNVIEIANKIEDFADIIKNDGYDSNTGKEYSISDFSKAIEDFLANDGKPLTRDLSSASVGFFGTQVIRRVITKMELPDLELWRMISRDMPGEAGDTIYTTVIGTNGHATTRISENGEYNSITLESTEDYIRTINWKAGVKVKYSEEAKRRMGLGVIKMLVEAALNDLKRYKSTEAAKIIETNAKTFFDGLDPAKMPSGVGRANLTQKNGTLLMRDLRDFFAKTQTLGFEVDTLIIHPLAYAIFMNDPTVQKFFKESANVYFLLPKKRKTIFDNELTKMKRVTSGTVKAAEGQEVIVAPIGSKTYKIIVTPLVSFHKKGMPIYDPATRFTKNPVVQHASAPNDCTDILAIDSSRALTYAHDGRGVIIDTIQNRFVDSEEIKFKEYYSFILDKDHGVFAFRNINVTDDVVDVKGMPEVITYTKADVI